MLLKLPIPSARFSQVFINLRKCWHQAFFTKHQYQQSEILDSAGDFSLIRFKCKNCSKEIHRIIDMTSIKVSIADKLIRLKAIR
jgi:hypothetical protein